jgi:alkylation response protein AidB-like acyl-CoA dehydrogenase
MDTALTAEQEDLRKTIAEFARRELNAGAAARDRAGEFPMDLWRRCAEMNLPGLGFPESYGGCGQDFLTTVLCIESLAQACTDGGLVHALLTQIVCGKAIELFGDEEQKRRFLGPICRGQWIAAQAASEAEAGSDVFSLRTTARREEAQYALNGRKMFISNGPLADVILILALTDPQRKTLGAHSLLIVEKDTPGLTRGKPFEKMGLRTLQNCELILDDCRVPAANLVGRAGQGAIIFNEIMEWERILFAACHLGAMERVCAASVRYAHARAQFGQPIGKFEAVSGKIARMKMNIELTRLMVCKAAALKDGQKRATMESAILKVFASESLQRACADAVQVHGAHGYMTEAEIERDLRDSVAATIYSGTAEVNAQIIARLLGL